MTKLPEEITIRTVLGEYERLIIHMGKNIDEDLGYKKDKKKLRILIDSGQSD